MSVLIDGVGGIALGRAGVRVGNGVVEEVVVGGGEARGGGGEAEAAVELFVEGGRGECREDGQDG